jgi:predicted permease
MNFALRIYRRLAEAFPHEFKLVYGAEIVQLGEDVVEEIAREHGVAGLFRLLADMAVRIPLEYLSEMRGDMRYAVRALRKSPGFALVAILSLAIGMGVTTSVFTTVQRQLFRDIPAAAHSAELAMQQSSVSYPYIEQYRAHPGLFRGVAAFQTGVPFNVAFQGNANAKPQRIFGQLVSPDYFSVLGVSPQRGRLFSAAADRPGDAPAVVITDRFWRDRLNSSPDALGQTLRLNGQPATIVGITPRDFHGAMPIVPADLFVSVTAPAALAPELANDVLHNRALKPFLAIMRLAPGVTLESAEAGLDAVVRHLDDEDSSQAVRADKGRRVTLLEGGRMQPMPRSAKPVFIGFYSVLLGLVLTIACMNLANMLLARGAARRKEFAIRLAVGASRFRLIRQMMSEGILLALAGGAAGFGLAYWFSLMTSQFKLPLSVPLEVDRGPDWRALVFTFALAVLCGIGFSLAPALAATRAEVAPTLKEGATQLRGYRRFGLRNLLVVGQVAGSLMLLLVTGFVVIGFSTVGTVQTRFDAHTLFLLSIDPVRDGYSPERAQALFETLPARLRASGAVRAVALAAEAPFSILGGTAQLTGESDAQGPAQLLHSVPKDSVGAGYFAALSEPLLAGREFSERDQAIAVSPDGSTAVPMPAVLNETAARGLFGSGSAVGQRITEARQSFEVVGVVHDLKNGIVTGQSAAVMYLPLTHRDFSSPPPGGMVILVRSDAGADALEGVRRQIAAVDPNLAVFDVQTLAEHLEISRSYLRLAADIFGGIGVFGLLLAAIGLAGVTAYAVARRRKEIGIRVALGANQSQVLRLVLREGTALVSIGTALGFLGALALVKTLSSLTSIFVDAFHVATNDPRLLLGAPLLLGALAMTACYLPARRSSKVDPLLALRSE